MQKALTRVSGAQIELFDEKNQRSEISWQGPFNRRVSGTDKFDDRNKDFSESFDTCMQEFYSQGTSRKFG
jgi:hypothetical protein